MKSKAKDRRVDPAVDRRRNGNGRASAADLYDAKPPGDPDAEKALLGSIMVDPAMIERVAPIVGRDDFAEHRHRALFDHLCAAPAETARDVKLLVSWLRSAGDLKEIGGPAYLADVMQSVPYAANAVYYANIVRDLAIRRRLAEKSLEIFQAAHDDTIDAADLAARAAEMTQVAPEQSKPVAFKRITCADLDAASYRLEYLVDGALVAGQPCILAGGKKTLKTSLLIDLGISLAVGGSFLGRLKVNRACRVGIMTGESGLATVQETARRIAAAAGQRLGDIGGLVFSEDLPQFGSVAHQEALRRFIAADGLEVIAVDPAYMCIPEVDHANLFEVGTKLRGVSQVCQESGAMLLLAHHARKGKVDPFSPMELEDISWAGFQEFARQWLLIGRRELYQPGTGEHRLWLSAGGSAGHSGLWAVDIAEGTRETPGGRFWQVDVMPATEARADADARREAAKAQRAEERAAATLESDRRELVKIAARLKTPQTKTVLRDRATLGHGQRFDRAFASLTDDGTLEVLEITKGNNRPVSAWRLRETGDP